MKLSLTVCISYGGNNSRFIQVTTESGAVVWDSSMIKRDSLNESTHIEKLIASALNAEAAKQQTF
jgi:hypothetical protein